MGNKVAVAFVHGMGNEQEGFSQAAKHAIRKRLKNIAPHVEVEMAEVNWGGVFFSRQEHLVKFSEEKELKSPFGMRNFLLRFLADIISYPMYPKADNDRDVEHRKDYDDVHICFAQALRSLKGLAGGDAPLIIVAHSFGTVIASHYMYDLQHDFQYPKEAEVDILIDHVQKERSEPVALVNKAIRENIDEACAIECGKTLVNFITLGSPLPLFLARYQSKQYGLPIQIPAPYWQEKYQSQNGKKPWVNFFEEKDVIAYPLSLNDAYKKLVHDERLNVGVWNPWYFTSGYHGIYWTHPKVVSTICEKIRDAWDLVNP